MTKTIFIEKSYIAASILNVKSKYLSEEFITLEEFNYITNQFQKKLNEKNFDAIILDKIDADYFDVSDTIKINKSKGLSPENIIDHYQEYLDLNILLLIWNKKNILDYLAEFKTIESNNENEHTFDVMAIPYNRAFVVSPEKTEEFKKQTNNYRDIACVQKLVETFRRNNLPEIRPVLKKTRKPDKK